MRKYGIFLIFIAIFAFLANMACAAEQNFEINMGGRSYAEIYAPDSPFFIEDFYVFSEDKNTSEGKVRETYFSLNVNLIRDYLPGCTMTVKRDGETGYSEKLNESRGFGRMKFSIGNESLNNEYAEKVFPPHNFSVEITDKNGNVISFKQYSGSAWLHDWSEPQIKIIGIKEIMVHEEKSILDFFPSGKKGAFVTIANTDNNIGFYGIVYVNMGKGIYQQLKHKGQIAPGEQIDILIGEFSASDPFVLQWDYSSPVAIRTM